MCAVVLNIQHPGGQFRNLCAVCDVLQTCRQDELENEEISSKKFITFNLTKQFRGKFIDHAFGIEVKPRPIEVEVLFLKEDDREYLFSILCQESTWPNL